MARDPERDPAKFSRRTGQGGPRERIGGILLPLLPWLFLLLVLLVFAFRLGQDLPEEIPYTEMKALVRSGEAQAALLEEHAITVSVPGDGSVPRRLRAVLPNLDDPELLGLLEAQDVEITAREPAGLSPFAYLLPWVAIFALFYFLQRRTLRQFGGFGGGFANLFNGRYSRPTETSSRVTFEDVAGQDQAKKEVAELVEFLREPERFQAVGAEIPHGVLLMGPPGTGKTLLAKALAGEADVPFFSTSGSEFVEVFVGVGAGRVRKMFEAAREAAPAVIFIDELDSIGRRRGTGLGGGNDEREQTLNQILAELDGFGEKEAVVVLAATNRPDVLDPALLRPGRFDRHVTLNLPERTARRAILEIHARKLPIANRRDLDDIAAGTPGFSGADLKNLLNEAAIQAARRGDKRITADDLGEARDKVMMGTVRSLAIQPEERHRLAVHEAGHTVAAYYSPEADPLYKVTIIPRGSSLGGTHLLSREEHHTLPVAFLRAQLSVLLAGRAAEHLLLGSVSSGAEDDIKRATSLARAMVARWGMADDVGPVDLRQSEDHPFLGQSIAQPRDFSDTTAARVDTEVMGLLKAAEAAATEVLTQHRKGLETLIADLEEHETLTFEEIHEVLEPGSALPSRRGREPDPAEIERLTRPPHVGGRPS